MQPLDIIAMTGRIVRAVWRPLSDVVGVTPAPRSSHTVTSILGQVCIFGGENSPRNAFDSAPHFLTSKNTWESAQHWNLPGLPLLGHNVASLKQRLYIFGGRLGGTTTFSGEDSGESGNLFIFDMDKKRWEQWQSAVVGRPQPEPRSFHAMCSAEQAGTSGLIFVFGGCGLKGRLNDLWSFDPSSGIWVMLHPGDASGSDAPKARGGSSIVATADGSRLVLLFGFSGKQQGDIAVFDLSTNKWQLLPHQEQRGDVPSSRSVFAAAALQARNEAVLFGGEVEASDLGHAGAGKFTSDLHVLDLDSLIWKKVKTDGAQPTARGWSGMAVKDVNRLILFGGLDTNNTRLGDTWELTFENMATASPGNATGAKL